MSIEAIVMGIGGFLAAVFAIFGYGARKKIQGRSEARTESREADHKRATTIEEKADAARSNDDGGSAVERLQRHRAFRD